MSKSGEFQITKELDECKFDIDSDGITYTPFCGNGDEKDLDYFIPWNDLRIIFMDEREMRKRNI